MATALSDFDPDTATPEQRKEMAATLIASGVPVVSVAECVKRAPSTIYQWFNDPDGEKVDKRKRGGTCIVCGDPTGSKRGGGFHAHCAKHQVRRRVWDRTLIAEAITDYVARYERVPGAVDLDRGAARTANNEEALRILDEMQLPTPRTIKRVYGTSLAAALEEILGADASAARRGAGRARGPRPRFRLEPAA